jgi:hypothetical protein
VDEQRSGCPSHASSSLRTSKQQCVQTDMSLMQLERRLNLSHGTIWDTAHEHLGYGKVCSRWVPRQLMDDHKKACTVTFLQQYVEEVQDSLGKVITEMGSRFHVWT